MSWSIQFIGEPKKVVAALEANSEKLDGYSKEEYDKALPHMVALVNQNFGNTGQVIIIKAGGHGYIENGVPKQGNLNVSVETTYGVVV